PIAEVKSYNAQQLYRSVQKIDWSQYLHPKMTLAVNCTGKNKQLNHSHFTALQIKNSLVDWQYKKYGRRSDIDVENPDLLINGHINNNKCTISLDSSGSSLHRRGYRPAMGFAPLKETLAAAIIAMTEWTPDLAFFDPLCGSGTLPIEAALKALNIAPGLYRNKFGFESWLDFDLLLWEDVVTEAKEQQLSVIPAPIWGSDRNSEIIEQAQVNATNCGVEDKVLFTTQELSNVTPPADKGVIVCNPPYGQRLGKEAELVELYQLLGDIFKQRFTGWTAYILTGSQALTKKVGLRTSRRIKVYNGAIPCTLLKYELY
ncbi:MAG: THUMP domain-containing protein, partial [Xenococcaceae cyanobacterium MO_234.B1]|nr:THUMP domain-containing protein [Xenococcaceae cyanobacterium MO_234.B1]